MTSIGTLGLNMATAATIVVFIGIIVGVYVVCGFALGAWEPWSESVDTSAWPIEVGVAVGPGPAPRMRWIPPVAGLVTGVTNEKPAGPLTARKERPRPEPSETTLRTLGDLRREQRR